MDRDSFVSMVRASSFVLLILVLSSTMGEVDETHVSQSSTPLSVRVGVWLLNVQKFDLSTGSYDVDFYLWFNSSAKPLSGNYEFMNGKASSVEVEKKTDNYLEVRVKGTFLKSLDFRNYPFDRHQLAIEIEDRNASIKEFVFVPDNEGSGIDSRINIPGWSVEEWSIESYRHDYRDNEAFSRLVFSFTIGRSASSSIVKTVVPISVITGIAMLAFLIPPSKHGQRIGLGVSTLTAAAANHLTLINQIPPVGYLTLFDRIMVTAYGLFLYSLIVSVLAMKLFEQNRGDSALKLSRITGLLIPVVIVSIFGSVSLLEPFIQFLVGLIHLV